MIAALALATFSLTRRPRVDPALAKDVQVYVGIKTSTPDYQGTDLTGFIENNGRVPVDVTVRVRCRDISDRVTHDFELRPFRNLAPGSSTSIRHFIATIPIAKVEMDLAELAPSPPR